MTTVKANKDNDLKYRQGMNGDNKTETENVPLNEKKHRTVSEWNGSDNGSVEYFTE